VWVVADGRAEPREVTTGLENPERVEITAGLRGDEQVVARGHEALYAGARVSEVGKGGAATGAPPGPSQGASPPAPVPPTPFTRPASPAKEAPHGTTH
jgi:hypothetical protein